MPVTKNVITITSYNNIEESDLQRMLERSQSIEHTRHTLMAPQNSIRHEESMDVESDDENTPLLLQREAPAPEVHHQDRDGLFQDVLPLLFQRNSPEFPHTDSNDLRAMQEIFNRSSSLRHGYAQLQHRNCQNCPGFPHTDSNDLRMMQAMFIRTSSLRNGYVQQMTISEPTQQEFVVTAVEEVKQLVSDMIGRIAGDEGDTEDDCRCAICLEDYSAENPEISLECDPRHKVHEGCIRAWMEQNPRTDRHFNFLVNCPLCNKTVKAPPQLQVVPFMQKAKTLMTTGLMSIEEACHQVHRAIHITFSTMCFGHWSFLLSVGVYIAITIYIAPLQDQYLPSYLSDFFRFFTSMLLSYAINAFLVRILRFFMDDHRAMRASYFILFAFSMYQQYSAGRMDREALHLSDGEVEDLIIREFFEGMGGNHNMEADMEVVNRLLFVVVNQDGSLQRIVQA